MPDRIHDYLIAIGDPQAPIVPKKSLNTRDNYQIYSLYSTTVISTELRPEGNQQLVKTDKDIIAVQKYHPVKPLFDFDAIAKQYP